MYKIAFTGSSGSGKTTLVKYVAEQFKLNHISGSAGDVKKPEDDALLTERHGVRPDGHSEVIAMSAQNVHWGLDNQLILQQRRAEIILNNENFVTDRSPIDNLTYMVNQVGFHKQINDQVISHFMHNCLAAWRELTHVIYVKAVQPGKVEDNGSRVANKFYQKSIDAQFNYWLDEVFLPDYLNTEQGPRVLIIDFWDLEERKTLVKNFLLGKL